MSGLRFGGHRPEFLWGRAGLALGTLFLGLRLHTNVELRGQAADRSWEAVRLGDHMKSRNLANGHQHFRGAVGPSFLGCGGAVGAEQARGWV